MKKMMTAIACAALLAGGCSKDDDNNEDTSQDLPPDTTESLEPGISDVAWLEKSPDGSEVTTIRLKKNRYMRSYELLASKSCADGSVVAAAGTVTGYSYGFALNGSPISAKSGNCSLNIAPGHYTTELGIGKLSLAIGTGEQKTTTVYERDLSKDLAYSCLIYEYEDLGRVCTEHYTEAVDKTACLVQGGKVIEGYSCKKINAHSDDFSRTCLTHKVENGKLFSSFSYFVAKNSPVDVCSRFEKTASPK